MPCQASTMGPPRLWSITRPKIIDSVPRLRELSWSIRRSELKYPNRSGTLDEYTDWQPHDW